MSIYSAKNYGIELDSQNFNLETLYNRAKKLVDENAPTLQDNVINFVQEVKNEIDHLDGDVDKDELCDIIYDVIDDVLDFGCDNIDILADILNSEIGDDIFDTVDDETRDITWLIIQPKFKRYTEKMTEALSSEEKIKNFITSVVKPYLAEDAVMPEIIEDCANT